MKKKKAQMEIMGLAIIVVLVALAMLFVVRFVVLKSPTEIKKTFTYTQLSANTLNTLLKTTTGCKGQDVTQLLQDCAASENIICEDGNSSCYFVNKTINGILEQTLVKWNKEFVFNATLTDISFVKGSCLGERQSKLYPIPTDAGVMIVRLDICG